MSPVLKKSMHRRTIPAPPEVRSFMSEVLECQENLLPALLDSFNKWTFPKGDLFQWIDVLNKCDTILENLCKKYELKNLQKVPFSEPDKYLLVSIVRFSVFLLDHCANRSLYASSNNINELLCTTDVDVLEQTCRISLRLAQRASYQRNGRAHFALSQEKLWKLATSLQYATKGHGSTPIPMNDLVGASSAIQEDWSTMRFWYFRSSSNAMASQYHPDSSAPKLGEPPATPTPSSNKGKLQIRHPQESLSHDTSISPENTADGLVLVELTAESLRTIPLEQAVLETIESSALSKEHHFDLLLRMRFAKSVSEPRKLQQLVNIRVLALAALAHVVSEPVLQSRLFSVEPSIIVQLAKVVHPDSITPQEIRAAGCAALEAIAHHRSRLGEVLNALGASISHGLLMYCLRKAFLQFECNDPQVSTEFIDALISLIHYLSTTNVAGSMLCSAGLVQVLAQLILNRHVGALRTLVKSLNLLDHLVYGFPQAFQIFCESRGLENLVLRIQYEVDLDISSASSFAGERSRSNVDYSMTHERFSLLKTMLKFVVHMMQTSGTADGLRNLIETTLPKVMRRVYEHADVFGSSIFASTTNIMATFIHNEPSSYQILHEIGLPEMFLSVVAQGIPPASDALTAIPNAFGAICLNAQGHELFTAHNPLPKFMRIFTSAKHCETMRDTDIGGLLGSSMDELVRHHPSLREPVMQSLMSAVQEIVHIGRRTEPSTRRACTFMSTSDSNARVEDTVQPADDSYVDEDGIERPVIVVYIDVIARFLEGFMQNSNLTREFITANGQERLLEFYEIGSLSYDFAKSHAALSLSHILRLACEVNPEALLQSIFCKVSEALRDLEDFIDNTDEGSYFEPFLAGCIDKSVSNLLVRKLQRMHSLCVLLSDLYAAPLVGHGRSAVPFYQTLTGDKSDLLHDLGKLHRKVIWEDIKISNSLSSEWVKATQPKDDNTWQKQDDVVAESSGLTDLEYQSARYRDLKMIRFFLCQMPPCILPFYQGLSKMIVPRRGADQAQRSISFEIAGTISSILSSHLSWTAPDCLSTAHRQSYALMMLTVASMLLTDERGPSILITSLLIRFEEGVHQMVRMLESFWMDLKSLPVPEQETEGNEDTETEQARISGAMKLILHLFQQFTAAKAVLESPQSLQLDSKDRNKDKPEYFNPHDLLHTMRCSILPQVLRIYGSAEIDKLSPSIFRHITSVMAQAIVVEWPTDSPSVAARAIEPSQSSGSAISSDANQASIPLEQKFVNPVGDASKVQSDQDGDISMDRIPSTIQALCEQTKHNAVSRAIEILKLQPGAIFDLAEFIVVCIAHLPKPVSQWTSNGVGNFLDVFRTLLATNPSSTGSTYFNAVAHLFAKLVHEDAFYNTWDSQLINSATQVVLELLPRVATHFENAEGATNLLVVYDELLAHQDSPLPIRLTEHGKLVDNRVVLEPLISQTQQAFNVAVSLLEKPQSTTSTLSILRFLVRVTKSRQFGSQLATQSGLKKLLVTMRKQIGEWNDNLKITFVVLLRHLIESSDMLRLIMQEEIKSWFHGKSRSTDISSFVKQNIATALRDPALFCDATEQLCCLPKYDPETTPLQFIALRPEVSKPPSGDQEMSTDNTTNLPEATKEQSSDDNLIAVILSEISGIKIDCTSQAASDPDGSTLSDTVMTGLSKDPPLADLTFKREEHPDFLYQSFLFSCLTELLASYPKCKEDFMTYTRQRPSTESGTPWKSRFSALTLFLNEFMAQNSILALETIGTKKLAAIENFSREALVSLCAATPGMSDPDIQRIRRSTIEAILKGLRETVGSAESLEVRYAKITAFAELIQRLLTTDTTTNTSQPLATMNETHRELAKLMLERNFVGLLTQALSEINLQYPASRKIIKAVLRPLRYLTKTSVRLNETAESVKPYNGLGEDGHEYRDFEESDIGEGNEIGPEREETPDLYRNSALGMFGAEMHDSDEDDYSNDDDEMYDEDMEFDEDGSETGSAVSDEDLELDDDGQGNQHDVEIILDEDNDDESTGSEDDSMSDDSAIDSSLSAGLQMVERDGEESDWQIEEESLGSERDLTGSRPADELLHELREDLVNTNNTALSNDDNEDDTDDLESEEAEEALLGEEGLGNEQSGEEPWGWIDATDADSRPGDGNGLASRLWTSLAPMNHGAMHAGSVFEPDVQIFRRSRIGGEADLSASRDTGSNLTNPLLQRPLSSARAMGVPDSSFGDNFSEWIESIEALIGGGAVQLIGEIMRRPSGAQGRSRNIMPAIRVEVSGSQRDIIPAQVEQLLRRVPQGGSHGAHERGNDLGSAIAFDTSSSARRHQDETLILYGSNLSERVSALIHLVLTKMAPAAVREREARELAAKAETDDLEAPDDTQRVDSLSGDDSLAQQVLEIDSGSQQVTSHDTRDEPGLSVEGSDSMDGIEATSMPPAISRQTIQLRGQDVDITGLGVDLEFLEALPEDMREEVLTQHIRERRASAQSLQQPTAELTPEFLEALPAEIRAELIQQETADRRRHDRLARQRSTTTPTALFGPTDMDPASFLASLDPVLRQSILVEQDEEFLHQLPPAMLAEISHGRARAVRERLVAPTTTRDTSIPTAIVDPSREPDQSQLKRKRDAVQLLDKAGIAALLRLIFLSAPQRNILHDVLSNLCENRNNRAEILGQLLYILLEGSSDINAAERCLHGLTRRSKLATADTPAKTPKKLLTQPHLGSLSPATVALQALQALAFLLNWNEQMPAYFLTEHEITTLRKSSKGKNKLKDHGKSGKYPINNVMLMLDRPDILGDPDLLEPLSHLLSSITRPLLLLLKKRQKITQSKSIEHDVSHAPTSSDSMDTHTTSVQKSRSIVPPDIPIENLKLVVNIVTADACSGKTFQHTLATIYHLSALEDAQGTISAELLRQAQQFIDTIREELVMLASLTEEIENGSDVQGPALSSFSSANSHQAKLLRILKTIDYLYDESKSKAIVPNMSTDCVSSATLFESLSTNLLWTQLSSCLTTIHKRSDMIHVATVLLPLIEALMVVCKNAITSEGKPNIEATKIGSSRQHLSYLFFDFTEDHKKILNQMVRNNPALMSGSFSLLTKNPKVLEFDNKRNYFTRRVRDRGSHKDHYPPIQLHVRRDAVFLDSYKDLHFKSGSEIKYSKLNIRFAGEEGIDAGGVSREWFQVLSRQMFDPNYALFVPVNADRNTYHPNKTSGINPEHLLFFKFVGRIVGKALYDGRLLDCHFSRPVYRKILGKNVSLKDMETLDLEYYKSLVWMLENDITDVITENFSVERDDFGVVNIIDLVPNGRNILVTEQNKQEYVARVTEYRLLESVSEQLDCFLAGFNEIIPPELAAIFNEQELELLISGLPDIDADDWRNNTEYHNYTAASPQIQWFWRAVRTFDDEERARLLQFCTGSSRIPVEGFAHLEGMHGVQKFNIHRDYSSGSRLPQSHTCFNQLDLPEYESYEVLRSSVLTAISEGNEGFGFA